MDWQAVTIGVGAVACLTSFSMFVYFIRSGASICRAVAFDKLAECISNCVILIFSLMYYFTDFGEIPFFIAGTLRMIAYIATTSSSINLGYQTARVKDQPAHNESHSSNSRSSS